MSLTVDVVKEKLGADSEVLNFTDYPDYVHIAKGWLDNGQYERINAIVKDLGGSWFSEGKLSHWRIPKNPAYDPFKSMGEHIEGLKKAYLELQKQR